MKRLSEESLTVLRDLLQTFTEKEEYYARQHYTAVAQGINECAAYIDQCIKFNLYTDDLEDN